MSAQAQASNLSDNGALGLLAASAVKAAGVGA